jgi:hypothetical protein
MLNERQAQSGTPFFPAPAFINPEKAFKNTRDKIRCNPLAIVCNPYNNLVLYQIFLTYFGCAIFVPLFV